jgi:ribosomal protein S18 acetylase RimI-like enzyme
MAETGTELELSPLPPDGGPTIEFGRAAARLVAYACDPAQDPVPFEANLVEPLRNGTATGRLVTQEGRPVGLVLWDGGVAMHSIVNALYLAPGVASVAGYRTLLERVRALGPIHLLPSPLNGLTSGDEESLLGSLGFDRFGRTEMRRPADAKVPDEGGPAGLHIRPAAAADPPVFARLLGRAFEHHFDRYLFASEPDYAADTRGAVEEALGGRYGPFLPWASAVAERPDGPVGTIMVVRAPTGPLILNVAVDPDAQGRGIGRALVVFSVRALAERGEAPPFLNVTEGNGRARGLYEGLGFVPTLTGWSWYSTETTPVAPDGSPTSRATSGAGSVAR